METNASQREHYLKSELYRLLQQDGSIFNLLQTNALDGIWYGDLERPEEEWYSPRFKALLGYRDDEVPNAASWWQERIFGEDLAVVQENLLRHCEDPEHPYDQIVRFRHKDGSTVWVRRRGVAIRDVEGRPIRLLGGQTDLTALQRPGGVLLKRLPQDLKQVIPDAYAATFEWAPIGMVLIDGEGKIVMFNAAAERMFGHLREDVTGKPVEMLVPERVRARHVIFRSTYQERPEARAMGANTELFGLRKDGVEFPVEIGLNPIQTLEGTLVLSAIVEITERKRAEQRLRSAAAELARSNADLEQFAYAASHDLQEPLRMIAGFLQLLEKRLSDSLDDEAREYMNYTLEGAERMRALINDLLAYSRVQTSSKPRESISLQAAIQEALANLRFAIEESHAEVSCADLPTIEADPVQMTQLFQNLIGNAIKFRGDQPLRIAVGLRDGAPDVLELGVSDNGIGIEPRFTERIFGLFQRLHVREEYPGTGIGLAICKRIVERHGGVIRCESSAGKGATFVISLPRKASSWS